MSNLALMQFLFVFIVLYFALSCDILTIYCHLEISNLTMHDQVNLSKNQNVFIFVFEFDFFFLVLFWSFHLHSWHYL